MNLVSTLVTTNTNFIDNIASSFSDYLPKLGMAALIAVVGWIFIALVRRLTKKILKNSKLEPTAHKIIIQITDVLLKLILILMVLGALGVDTTSAITLIGAVGLAVSLALQSSLSNFAGGILILMAHPFRKGDFIEANGVSGTVQGITLWSTKLITADNKDIFVPNGELSEAKIINYSMEKNRRLDIVIPIGYEEDVLEVKDVLLQIAKENPLTMEDPAPSVGVSDFGAHAVEMFLKVWVTNESFFVLRGELLEKIKITFDQKGISIPYQQMDVHLKGENKG